MNIRNQRFLTDENIDRELVEFLRLQTFDVLDIKEEGLFRLSDRSILEFGLSQQRIIISQDSDFGTLIFRDHVPYQGVIYLRPGHELPAVHIESMTAILNAELELVFSFVLVAENTGDLVRIRLRNT